MTRKNDELEDCNDDDIEHTTPTCPNCGSNKTRPLDRENATFFDCNHDWRMIEETQEEVANHWLQGSDTNQGEQ